jgi:hypothetical protein
MNRVMAGDALNDSEGKGLVPSDKESLSSRMRDLLMRVTVEERRKPQEGTQSAAERRRRTDPAEPSDRES